MLNIDQMYISFCLGMFHAISNKRVLLYSEFVSIKMQKYGWSYKEKE